MKYEICRLPVGTEPIAFAGEFDPAALPAPFDALNEIEIADYPWLNAYPDRFPTFARAGWNEDGITVLMYAEEAPVLSRETGFGGAPCRDSCMEFFFIPFPEADARYLNIEINPFGAPHVGIGEGRYDRRVYKTAIDGMTIRTSKPGKYWAISYRIPMSLIEAEYGRTLAAGQTMRGNFYKCSEDIHPHFGTWNPVVAPQPDFHRPECFGEIVLK